jgi:capsular exopolysaccharide synthesis family protein
MFGTSREPGLSNVMVGTTKASDAVRRTLVTNLWCLPAGKLPPNPAELLGSKRFREFLGSLSDHFDWIVIDSPPVMAVTDPTILAHFATGVVYVVGCEMAARGTAKTAINHLDSARAKHLGVILNRVELQRHGYYYANYYRKEYADHYVNGA